MLQFVMNLHPPKKVGVGGGAFFKSHTATHSDTTVYHFCSCLEITQVQQQIVMIAVSQHALATNVNEVCVMSYLYSTVSLTLVRE